MNSADPKTIRCGTHGTRLPAIVCRHMIRAKDRVVGFVENNPDPADLQAWCDHCERVFIEEGDKTERFRRFNDFAVVCDFCYAAFKARHGGESCNAGWPLSGRGQDPRSPPVEVLIALQQTTVKIFMFAYGVPS
jgi:hypothetical protein